MRSARLRSRTPCLDSGTLRRRAPPRTPTTLDTGLRRPHTPPCQDKVLAPADLPRSVARGEAPLQGAQASVLRTLLDRILLRRGQLSALGLFPDALSPTEDSAPAQAIAHKSRPCLIALRRSRSAESLSSAQQLPRSTTRAGGPRADRESCAAPTCPPLIPTEPHRSPPFSRERLDTFSPPLSPRLLPAPSSLLPDIFSSQR
jgi:hypothetical protein